MKRAMQAAAIALVGLLSGAAVSGCLYGSCPEYEAIDFEDGRLTFDAAGETWGGRAIDDQLTVDVDLATDTVEIAFASGGAAVVQVYEITSIGPEYE